MSENPYECTAKPEVDPGVRIEPTSWRTIACLTVYFFSFVVVLLCFVTWLAAFMRLGRSPIPNVDDPMGLGFVVRLLQVCFTLATIAYPVTLFFSFGIIIWGRKWLGIMATWNRLGITALLLVQLSAVAIFFRIDPLRIMVWLAD